MITVRWSFYSKNDLFLQETECGRSGHSLSPGVLRNRVTLLYAHPTLYRSIQKGTMGVVGSESKLLCVEMKNVHP